jgi:hypothetical protein
LHQETDGEKAFFAVQPPPQRPLWRPCPVSGRRSGSTGARASGWLAPSGTAPAASETSRGPPRPLAQRRALAERCPDFPTLMPITIAHNCARHCPGHWQGVDWQGVGPGPERGSPALVDAELVVVRHHRHELVQEVGGRPGPTICPP